ncbi:MAG TPA: M48 family peptidase, partial [Thermomonas sp.]|nr:M48 family peptidase [Thermomonas sp.]
MNQYPSGQSTGQRRGGLRLWVLLLFAGYAAWYWFSNRSIDPLTGQAVVIDKSISPEQEKSLGLQAYQQVLQQEKPLSADAEASKQVRAIAERLIGKIPQVTDSLAAEHHLQA